MKSELELKIYDKEILYLMYMTIFDISPKYLAKVSTTNEIKEGALNFFRQDTNFALLKEHYGKLSCGKVKWDKSH